MSKNHYFSIYLTMGARRRKFNFVPWKKHFFKKITKLMSRRDYNHIQHIIKVQICRKCPKLEKYFFELGTLAKAECHRHKLSFPHSSTLPTATCSARVASPRRIWTGRWRLAGAPFRRQSTTWTTPLSDSAKPSRRSRFAFWFYTICWFAVRKYAQKISFWV